MVKLTPDVLRVLNDRKYAKRIKKIIEPLVADNPFDAYWYAFYALDGQPFPAGEAALSTSTEYAFKYAYLAICAPFPAGEKAIAQDVSKGIRYARNVLRLPESEVHQWGRQWR